MSPILLMRVTSTVKTEAIIVLSCILAIVCLPVITFLIVAKTSVVALADNAVDILYQGAVSPTDTYDWGNCTYWVALLRQQAGDPIPNTWGNAATWATRAAADGYLVDHTPAAGAIMQISSVDNGLGHVAYVVSVDPTTGSWTISEMNVKGFDIVDTQTLPASAAASYNFIYDKNP